MRGPECLCVGVGMLTQTDKRDLKGYVMLTKEGFSGCWSGFLSFPGLVGGRQHAELGLEVAGEVFGIVEAAFIGYLGHGKPALFQQLGGPFQADRADEFDGGLAGEAQEPLVQAYAADK